LADEKDIAKIVDEHIRTAMLEHLDKSGGDFKKAFSDKSNPLIVDGVALMPDHRVITPSHLKADGTAYDRDYALLREHGVLPIETVLADLPGSISMSVNKQTHAALVSFEAKKLEFAVKKQEWYDVIAEERYRNQIQRNEALIKHAKFNAKRHLTFIQHWRANIHSYLVQMLQKDASHKFLAGEELCGYPASFLQMLFDDYRDLWEVEDFIGNQYIVRLFSGAKASNSEDGCKGKYHFLKDHINISDCGAYGKNAKVLLGSNLIAYGLDFHGWKNNRGDCDWLLTMNNPLDENKPIKMRVCHGNFLNHFEALPSSDQ
jgi:hypothetical protein